MFKYAWAFITQRIFSKDSFERRWEDNLGKQKKFFPKMISVPLSSWFPGISRGFLAKRSNRKDVSFGVKMLIYQKSPYTSWNNPGLLTFHTLPDNYHPLDKGADTAQPTCTFLQEASSYFFKSLNIQCVQFSRYNILKNRTLSSWKWPYSP